MFAVRRGDGVVGVARAFAFALDCFSPASLRGSRASAAFRGLARRGLSWLWRSLLEGCGRRRARLYFSVFS